MRPPPFRWSLLVPVALVMVMPSVLAHGDEVGTPPEPDVLWLGVRSVLWEDWANFTTHPPAGEGTVQAPERHVDRASWTWFSAVPERWVVPAGTELRLVVTVMGLEETWPLPLPYGNDTEPFATAFEGEAWRGGQGGRGVFASGETLVPMDPVHPPEGPVTVTIPLHVAETTVVEAHDRFEARLHVYVRGVKHNSVHLQIGGAEASHLVAPGFPVAAFRTWEEAFPYDVCLWHRSYGEPCPESRLEGPQERAVEERPETAEASGAGALGGVALWLAWLLRRRRLVAP